jgi:hypothetical protein
MGWFDDQSLVIEQLVLPRPGEERPMLERLAERLSAATCVVSYNGKSYDWPLLTARYVMNRLPAPAPPPHLDLLHAARRVYRRRLKEVRLTHLEVDLLGLRRDFDVSGSEIPAMYWSFVRDRRASAIAPILAHNACDIAALAAILAVLEERFRSVRRSDDPRDHLGFGRVALRAKDHARAEDFLRAAASGGGDPAVTAEALMLEARLSIRARDHHRARTLLEQALAQVADDEVLAPPLHLALAKLFEHRLGRFELALMHARRAAGMESEAAYLRRLVRLSRREETARTARCDQSMTKGRRKSSLRG